MRLLYITNDLPWPLTSGYLRHYHFLRHLSERHDITLLSLAKRGHGPDDAEALAPFVTSLVMRPATFGRSTLRNRTQARITGLLAGGDRSALELGRIGARAHAEGPFDAIFYSGRRTYPVFRSLPDLPLVTDLCDATSSRIRRHLHVAGPGRIMPLLLEYLEIRRVERALMSRSDHVLFASVRDLDAIVGPEPRAGEREKSAVVPNGVDLAFWHRERPRLGTDTIVLTGAMDYEPNADAAIYLVETVLPIVRASHPAARVAIVGRDPSPEVAALAAQPGVVVTGFVDDVRPYLEDAAVFAAPIRFGAGIQNKVLESMSMEVPVVASPLAADGLRTDRGEVPPIDVAADAAGLAAHIVTRLKAAAETGQPDAAARQYVTDHFDWTTSADRIDALLQDAVAQRQGRSG